ncbi:MAG: CHAT domain-containing protein [Sphaerospermopsis kisseleviana]
MSPLVSIVIVNYNRENYLGAAIASVLQQTWTDFELLVWDDGSTDGSVAIAQKYAHQDQRVRVVAAAHQGSVKAHKAVIAQTRGTYLGWVDSDDILAPTALAETVPILNHQPDVGLVYTDYVDINAAGELLGYGHRCSIPYSPQELLVNFMTFHFRLLRYSVYEQVGGVDISCYYAYDYDLCLRLSEVTQVRRVDKPLYLYRRHNQSISATQRTKQMLYSQQAIARALQRRGLAEKYRIDVELSTGRFILRHQQPLTTTIATTFKSLFTQTKKLSLGATCWGIFSLGGMNTAIAQDQQIISAPDGTNTIVTPNGNTTDITGGTSSGANLFHSFQRFGLSSGQSANFQADPTIQNILGRIVGGDASVINGLIQVTGGNNPNLFLMNPAGFIFGREASLNIPGSFNVTTANGIRFDNGWFNAAGNNNYSNLFSNPNGFAFTTSQPGAIINAGTLEVGTGQTLSLSAGTVVNTGTLTAPGGQILVTSLPGEGFINLSIPGNILSLDIPNRNELNNWTLPISSLPQLLTVGNTDTGLTVSDNIVTLNNTTIPSSPGTTIVSGNLNIPPSRMPEFPVPSMVGRVNILGAKVDLIDANINGIGSNINLTATNDITLGNTNLQLGTGYNSNSLTITSTSGAVKADPNSTLNTNGANLNISGASLALGNLQTSGDVKSGDVKLSASGNITAGDIVGDGYGYYPRSISVESTTGEINLGNINARSEDVISGIQTTKGFGLGSVTITANNGSITTRDINSDWLGGVTLNARNDITVSNIDASLFDIRKGLNFTGGNYLSRGVKITTNNGNIITGNINHSTFFSINSLVVKGERITVTNGGVALNARNNITVGDINTSGRVVGLTGDYQFTSGNVRLGTTSPAGSIIRFNSINTTATSDIEGSVQAGNVEILTNGLIQGTGNTINTGEFLISNGGETALSSGGTVTIQHDGGPDNLPFTIGASTANGMIGAINAGADAIISSGSFPVLPNGGAANGTPSRITINSVNTPPTLTVTSPIALNAQPGVPVDFTFTAEVENINQDNLTVVIDAIAGTLRRGNTVLAPGDILTIGETLNYTPPENISTSGNVEAFRIKVSDGVSFSPIATPITQVVVTQPQPQPQPQEENIKEIVRQTEQGTSTVSNTSSSVQTTETTETNETTKDTDQIQIQQATGTQLDSNTISEQIVDLENDFSNTFANRLGVSAPEITTREDAIKTVRQIEETTGIKPALIYLSFVPVETSLNKNTPTKVLDTKAERNNYELEILVVTGKGDPIRKRISGATQGKVLEVAQEFRNQIVNPQNRRRNGYLKPSQQLYDWIIAPLEADLEAEGINNLVFIPDVGLRTTPIAAFHDGKQFLIEKYSVGLMPSLSLTNTVYTDIKNSQVLAFGVSQSTQGQTPLPSVPFELSKVSQLWSGRSLLDKQATLDNLKSTRRQQPFGILHLATHADFIPGPLSNSYIQLWDDRLRLDQLRQLQLNDPPVEMLVLSACRTALGDEEVEIGFAGLAVLAGVKTSIASLWAVNDTSTAALMTKFYESLKNAPIRAEALRDAQVSMAQGKIYIQDGQLRGLEAVPSIVLPPEIKVGTDKQLTHPYYWAAFTMVGSPW